NCTNTAAAASGGTVYIQTSLPITSKQFLVGLVSTNEATVQIDQNGVAGPPFLAGAAGTVQGVVSGNQVSFQIPAGSLAGSGTNGGVTHLTISNIRVNASTGGAPQVTESGILSYSTVGVGGPTSANTAIAASVQGAGFI